LHHLACHPVDPEEHQWNPHRSPLQLEPEQMALVAAVELDLVAESEPEEEKQLCPNAFSAVESYNAAVVV
jgi:hypothetical protein